MGETIESLFKQSGCVSKGNFFLTLFSIAFYVLLKQPLAFPPALLQIIHTKKYPLRFYSIENSLKKHICIIFTCRDGYKDLH